MTELAVRAGGIREATAATRFDGRAMGSPLRLTLGGPAGSRAPSDAVGAWSAVVDEFEAAEAAMSRFRDDSELTELNRSAGTGAAMQVSTRLRRALVAADRARRITGGRFDPRVLVDLDRLGYRGASLGGATPRPPVRTPARWHDRDPTSPWSSSSVVAASLSGDPSTWVASGRA